MLRRLLLCAVLLVVRLLPAAAAGDVVVAEIHGAISPASAAYFQRALADAAARRAELLVLQLDTPGGLDTSMREMIQGILASPVPVATFVAPPGARAASAGTYLLYASHVAAMAPGTNVGAATPVQIGIGGQRGKPAEEKDGDKGSDKGKAREKGAESDKSGGKGSGKAAAPATPAAPADPMAAKVAHDAAAYLRSLAQLRGRNAEWAELAVREAQSLSADDALRLKVIDLVAADVPELLRRLDGRRVRVGESERKLALAGSEVHKLPRNWQERLLATIADPNVALLLMMIGVYGLLFEFYSPGMVAPGVIGGISLLLAAYGLALLPLNYAGLALLLLGLALMAAEAFLPSFGVIGIGGVFAFVAGALMLVDAEVPGLTVAWQLVLPLALLSALLLAAIGGFAVRARKRPPAAGREAMIGQTALALEAFAGEGWVSACGERWRARSNRPLAAGERARIVAVEGLQLVVKALDSPTSAPNNAPKNAPKNAPTGGAS